MSMKQGVRDALWLHAGAAILIVAIVFVFQFRSARSPDEILASRTRRAAAAERMLAGLASASEAEKSAVLAVTDEESRSYADKARLAAAEVESERRALATLLKSDGTTTERDALAVFGELFVEFRRIDEDILDLAVRNTNLKASALVFGPAEDAIREMSVALDRVVAASADAPEARAIGLGAGGAQIGALTIHALLPPHIAEESDAKMDEMEARMAAADAMVRKHLADLGVAPSLAGSTDVATAASCYARFGALRTQILALSRENSNVRSLSLSLNQKAKATRLCRDALLTLREAIEAETASGVPRAPVECPR